MLVQVVMSQYQCFKHKHEQPELEIYLAETHRLRVRCQQSWSEPQTKEITSGESPGPIKQKKNRHLGDSFCVDQPGLEPGTSRL